ncbi:hypothetical protein P280DRAFT_454027 [Massarina eburnea CBS 473.64]|uniref:Nucleoporin Nup120/160 n=1 Tax=Massarina eburnea CBS 473.64 TaxID=1395130 RepID=A0A6A6RXZ1_9PLEO|nr:hypothetical protein P280DRAFT_454027 [Massarina eburnea CBS 473.64]
MATTGGTCLYKEARLNIEPAFPNSTVSITLPAASASTFGLQTRAKRTLTTEQFNGQDEDAFEKRHLASDGSMFFRRTHKYPRSFLWRILDGRKTLEIQATDLDHDFDHKLEANLTLLLHFTSAIRPFCISFAEPEDRDALTVFAITSASELYTITLHRDFFIRPAASEQEVSDWCKRSSLNLLTTHVPYRMVAVGANELLVSLENGGIVRLTRDSKDEVLWQEDLYQQHNWSLRGMLSWKGEQTVRFDNAELSPSSAAALALSPDRKHIIAVCLDHRLRMFNIASGKLTLQRDLLHNADGSHERTPPYFIGPSQSTLLQVVDRGGTAGGADYHVVTYSPVEHQFRFWGVRDADDETHGIYDAKDDVEFSPPIDELMDATVWTMEEFIVVSGPAGWRGVELWVRARSGPSSKVYSLRFDLDDSADRLATVWKSGWTTVDSGPLTVEGLRTNPANPGEQEYDPSDPNESNLTDQWLDFLFFPGRFTAATLETAHMYFRKGLDGSRSSKSPKGSLKERLCATVTTFATETQSSTPGPESYEQIVAEQWRAFYAIVRDLHKRRGESLSLAYDHKLDMPWLVLGDYLSAIRKCSDSEVATLNIAALAGSNQLASPLRRALPKREDKAENREATKLLNAAASFRRRYPPSFQQELKRQVELDLLQSRPITILDRMEQIELNCDITQLPTEEDLASFLVELGMELEDLNTDIFIGALYTLHTPTDEHRSPAKRNLQIARYGLNALLAISRETLETKYNILLDILFLVLFMQFDEAGEELSADFDAFEIFVQLIAEFKDCLVLNWLATTVWSHQSSTGPSSVGLMKTLGETLKTSQFPMTQTVLEGVHGLLASDIAIPLGLKAGTLTYWSDAWLASVFSSDFGEVVEDTMGILLVQKEYALAMEFSKFSTGSAWSTYLKGRIHIALSENDRAAVCFKKAAHNLAIGSEFDVQSADSANLVSIIDRDDFSEGLPRYYKHVLGLFEKVKAYSYVADFAHLGLRGLYGNEDVVLKSELLQRLFTASLHTARFSDAYTAMIRHNHGALKHNSLQELIKSMVAQSETTALFAFPFIGLVDDVDSILADLCHKTLNLASGPPWHQILYSFRISRGNFRGAASILHERLQRLKSTSSKNHDPAEESLTQCYLMIINALSSVGEQDQYILAEKRIDDTVAPSWTIGKAKKLLKREVVSLETLRREYQQELDRVAAIETGQFPFVDPTDDMDIL